MANPSEKNSAIESLITEMNGGRNRRAYIHANKCIRCGGDASIFYRTTRQRTSEHNIIFMLG